MILRQCCQIQIETSKRGYFYVKVDNWNRHLYSSNIICFFFKYLNYRFTPYLITVAAIWTKQRFQRIFFSLETYELCFLRRISGITANYAFMLRAVLYRKFSLIFNTNRRFLEANCVESNQQKYYRYPWTSSYLKICLAGLPLLQSCSLNHPCW